MKKLVEGLHRFHSGAFRSQKELFQRLSKAQNPEALFITCSDSRIDPALLTQTAPGELFIMRNAGNIIPAFAGDGNGEVATVEFAVTGLGVKDIIVCGHTHCGAVRGLFDPAKVKGMPLVAEWVKHMEATRRIVTENYKGTNLERRVELGVFENVLTQLEHLETHPSVAVRLARQDLKLHGWVYDISSGTVSAFDPTTGQFESTKSKSATRGVPARGRARRLEI